MHISKVAGAAFTAVATMTLLTGGTAWAGEGELAGFGGFQHIPDSTKGTVGGAIGRVIGGNSLIFGETSYSPLGYGEKLVTFGGGFQFGIPTRMDKLVPYVVVVGGLGRDMVKGDGSSNSAMFGAGFGARYFLGSHWGVRPEFRWQRYQQTQGGDNTYLFTAGLFYRFGRR